MQSAWWRECQKCIVTSFASTRISIGATWGFINAISHRDAVVMVKTSVVLSSIKISTSTSTIADAINIIWARAGTSTSPQPLVSDTCKHTFHNAYMLQKLRFLMTTDKPNLDGFHFCADTGGIKPQIEPVCDSDFWIAFRNDSKNHLSTIENRAIPFTIILSRTCSMLQLFGSL